MATAIERKFLAILIVFSMILSVLPASAAYSALPPSGALTSLKIGSYIVSISTGDYTGWNSAGKTGWRYEKSSDRLVLVDYRNKSNNITATGDLTIAAAGFNQVGAININGNLAFEGSGIIMAESLTVNGILLYDGATAPAVFVKESGSRYILQNNGTLDDEKYNLLTGCTYVVPGGKMLTLAANDYGMSAAAGDRYSTTELIIPATCVMTIETGGKVVVGSIAVPQSVGSPTTIFSKICVRGNLNCAGTGIVEGEGLKGGEPYGAHLYLSETASAFNIRAKNVRISIDQAGNNTGMQNAERHLTLEGIDNVLELPQISNGVGRDFYLKSITLESGSKLDVRSGLLFEVKVFPLTITNGVAGSGTFNLTSGIVNIPNGVAPANEPAFTVASGVLSVNTAAGWKVITNPATYTSAPSNKYHTYKSMVYDKAGILMPDSINSLSLDFNRAEESLYQNILGLAETEFSDAGYTVSNGEIFETANSSNIIAYFSNIIVEVSGLDGAGKYFSTVLYKTGDALPGNMSTILFINILYTDVLAWGWGPGSEASLSSVYTGKGTLGSAPGPWPVPVPQPSAGGGSGSTVNKSQSSTAQPAFVPMKPNRPAGAEAPAEKTNNPLYLGGKNVDFPAVKIDGWNWLKLRDVAMMLKSTSKQFSIGYDPATKTISITSGGDYTPIGDELLDMLLADFTAIASGQKIMFNGKLIEVAAYNIDGYNYFRLRDLMILLNIAVIYDPVTGEITLDLTKPYHE